MELSRDQVVQLPRVRRVGEGEACEGCVGHLGERRRDAIYRRACGIPGLCLSEDEGEVEDQLVIVRQAEQERRDCGGGGDVRILRW